MNFVSNQHGEDAHGHVARQTYREGRVPDRSVARGVEIHRRDGEESFPALRQGGG